jgi:hypothetical protein
LIELNAPSSFSLNTNTTSLGGVSSVALAGGDDSLMAACAKAEPLTAAADAISRTEKTTLRLNIFALVP